MRRRSDEDCDVREMWQRTTMQQDFVKSEDVIALVVFVGKWRFVGKAFAIRPKNADSETIAKENAGVARSAHGLATDLDPAIGSLHGLLHRLVGGASRQRRRSARDIDFAESTLVLVELPLAQETKRAHAEREDRWNGFGSGEEGSSVQYRTVAAKGGGQVDFVLIGGVALAISQSVDGEAEGGVDFRCEVGLEDERGAWVDAVDVVGVFDQGIVDLGVVIFADNEDVLWW